MSPSSEEAPQCQLSISGPGPDGKLVYRVRVRRKGTPTQTATFTKLADAKQWAQMIEGHVLEGRHFPSMKPTRHTVSETIERYLCEILPHKSATTRYNQRYQLQWWSKQLGPSALRDLTPDLLSQWRDALAQTRAPASVRACLSVLSHVLTITVKEWGWLRDNPMHNVRMPRIPRGRVRYLLEDERQQLLNACKGSRNPWLYTVVVLVLSTGTRKMELLRLRWPDVDVQRQVITLHETKNPRSRSQVELPDFCSGETRCYGMKPYCAMMRLSQVTTGGASWPLLCSRFVP